MNVNKTEKIVYVVMGENKLLNVYGPLGVAFSKEIAEEVRKATAWISDKSTILEVNIWE